MDDPVLYKQAHGGNSQWEPRSSQPPDVGVVESTDDVVSFKTKGDHTLIADGDYSDNARGFDKDDDGKPTTIMVPAAKALAISAMIEVVILAQATN